MKPVLFLDIDGVLNSITWQQEFRKSQRGPTWGQLSEWAREAESSFDLVAIQRLNYIVKRTDCLVVLASSWRKAHPLPLLTRMLRHVGFEHRLFACTPHIHNEAGAVPRGHEIDWWIKQLGGFRTFAIADDDSDMEPWEHRLVQTNCMKGLTDEDAEQLCKLLEE